MSKQFYTEKDIEDLFQRGTKSLRLSDDVVLTELAYEKAKRLGFQLVTDGAEGPPAAPVRPYLTDGASVARPQPKVTPVVSQVTAPASAVDPNLFPKDQKDTTAVEQRIRSAVIAKLGNQVDAKL